MTWGNIHEWMTKNVTMTLGSISAITTYVKNIFEIPVYSEQFTFQIFF